ncbi:hypothetical protein [Sphingomonas sp. PB4P5]|uniref:hypothetical protein n=1 Tax=Parasphingomonas puruogangriensis TaxID=3096155 RepID=UPI002FC81C43
MSEAARDALPPAYAAFGPVLDQLSAPLREVLHGQLSQFERLIGSFDDVALRPQGDFEGLGGLTLRGDIAHIVQSELLLRTEAPIEFLRRLAESETLYHEKEYADPGATPVYRLTVSVGPGLLGHGRVLALAAIFFLGRVAAERNAAFHWCFVPRADGAVWFDALSINTIKRFLRAASHREASVEDVEEAHALWETLAEAPKRDADRRLVDWTIGAADRLPTALSQRAVSHAPQALSFAVRAPVADEARIADIAIRRKGREARRAALDFPANAICLSALNTPFTPLKPAQAELPKLQRTARSGWEPLYLIAPHGSGKVLRVARGLLVLMGVTRAERTDAFFLPIAPDMRLAGVRLRQGGDLSVLVQHDRAGRETLTLAMISVRTGMNPIGPSDIRSCDAVAAHLFRGQHRYALPMLFDEGGGVGFYSTHGRKFALDFTKDSSATAFRVIHSQTQIFHGNGAHHVIRAVEYGKPVLKVRRTNNSAIRDYAEGDSPIDPDTLCGMIYSGSHASLAYSTQPNHWTVAGDGGRDFLLANYETPLIAKMDDDKVVATIWSDARFGGDGTVRVIAIRGDERRVRETVLRLGDDATRVGELQITYDGILAVTLDESGAPAELLAYRRPRRDVPYACTRLALADLIEEAIDLDAQGVLRG